MWSKERNNNRELNRVDSELKEYISNSGMVAIRDRKTLKCLGVSFTEQGLRGLANKNGVYFFCKGRITNFNDAKKAEKSPDVIVEKFVPKDFDRKDLASAEVHWAQCAKRHLTANSNANYNH